MNHFRKKVLVEYMFSKFLDRKVISFLFFFMLLFNTNAQIQIQFEEVLPINAPFDQVSAGSVAFADIDGDNDQDVLITGGESGTGTPLAKLFTNDGLGNYTLVSGTPFTGVYIGSVAFADVDGDNDQDVLITGDIGSSVPSSKLYLNDGAGNYSLVASTPFDPVRYSYVAFADIDGDNDQDVLITGYNGSTRISKLYSNDGAGTFSLVSGTPFQGVNSGCVAFADIDGDNDQDVLITGLNNSGSGITNLFTNDGLGNYTLIATPAFENSRDGSCAFADIDGDNDQDVLITGFNGSSEFSKLYSNDGTGTFSLVSGTPFNGVYHSSLAFADIDGDNDQDVLISGTNGVVISSSLYSNDGSGGYTLESNVNFENGYDGSLAFADIDGDSDQDVLITGSNNTTAFTKLYRNITCNANTGTDVITACNSYTWIDGNTYTTSNSTATYTLTNQSGCDSVVTLDLTINNSNTGTDVITACNSYTWIDGNTYTASNNTTTYTLTNQAGCDSVVTLDLTINEISDITTSVNGLTITANNQNATYQWLNCNANYAPISNETDVSFTATQNGSYAVELSENGCVDTSNCVVISTVGISELFDLEKFTVYPNPSSGQVNMLFSQEIENVELVLTSVQGRILLNKKLTNVSNYSLHIPGTSGVYFLTVKTSKGQQTTRLVKED